MTDMTKYQNPATAATPQPDSNLQNAHNFVQRLRQELQRAIVGQADIIDQTIIVLLANGHVLLEGVPGLGKTLLVRALAKCFNGQFARIQFTPDLMPSDVTGHAIYDIKTEQFKLRKGPIFTNLLLADEINRAPAKTQSALLEVMQERQATLEGESLPVPQPFMVLATQNPIEQEGTYPLPEAQLDRFMFKINIDYPAHNEESQLVKQVTQSAQADMLEVTPLQQLVQPKDILALQQITKNIPVDEQIIDYAVRLVRATRDHHNLAIGAGPRASIALIQSGKARALIRGGQFVIPDDIKVCVLPTLRHRIKLSAAMEIEGATIDQVLNQIIDQVAAPRL